MYKFLKVLLPIVFIVILFGAPAIAKQVYVKYRGVVETNNGYLSGYRLKDSSLVQEILFDQNHNYLIVNLRGTYYHYCGIPKNIVNTWVSASSLGKFYRSYIRGNYDCRVNPIPSYWKLALQ